MTSRHLIAELIAARFAVEADGCGGLRLYRVTPYGLEHVEAEDQEDVVRRSFSELRRRENAAHM